MEPGEAHEPAGARAPDGERVLVALLALGVAAAQLALRELDDSRLTSWRWVFGGVNPTRFFLQVAGALAVAHLAVRVRLPHRRAAAALFALACAAAACFWSAPEVVVDASRYFTQAKYLELHGVGGFVSEWGREIPAWTDLPLVPALYGLVFRFLGESRLAVQALTTLLFAGTLVLVHRIGRTLWDDELGLSGAALLLAIPYLLTQVPSLLVDVPTMFFVTLALHAVLLAVDRGGVARLLLAALAVALALLSKYSAWLLLSGIPVIGLIRRGRAPGALRAVAIAGGGATLLVAGALLLHPEATARQFALLFEYQAPGLRRWGERWSSTFLFQVHPFLSAAALASAWVALRRRDARWLVAAWPVLVLLLLDVRRVRYWVPAFPMLALLAAHGLQALRSAATRKAVAACAVACSLVVALQGDLPFLRRTSAVNLAEAGAYLNTLDAAAVEVITLVPPDAEVNPAVAVPLLDLYTAKRLVHASGEPPPEAVQAARESPLRFTWEYRNPAWYRGSAPADAPVVVVSGDLYEPLPPAVERRLQGLRLERTFATDEGVFRFRTLVRVYRAALSAPPPGTASGSSR